MALLKTKSKNKSTFINNTPNSKRKNLFTLKLIILGCNGALPAYGRFPTSMVLDMGMELMLIDCGEGAQIKMQEYGVRGSRINNVFISHLHGDHYYGLIGWLNSQGLLGRTKALHIFAPAGLQAIIEIQIDFPLPFAVHYINTIPHQASVLIETEHILVKSFPVDHSVPTHGFTFTLKKEKRGLLPEKLLAYEIPKYFYKQLTQGESYQKQNGEIIKNEWVTTEPKPNITFAYSADTAYAESIIPFIYKANALYHEATYTQEHVDKAAARKHSTAVEAATIALKAEVQQLIIGHYSSKYKTTDLHSLEAKAIFENTILAEGGIEILIQ